MGKFSNLFGSSSDIEKNLEDLYVPIFQMKMGLSASEAKGTFRDILKHEKEKSEKEGTSKLPQNFGDIMLEQESTNEEMRSMLAKKRQEGVRDEDIRWWCNMHDLEKRIMVAFGDVMKLAVYKKLREEDGLSEREAMRRLRKALPIFGNPEDTTHTAGEDRPLPFELKDRIEVYVEKRTKTDQEKLKKDLAESSSFNALIRKEMKNGNI